MFHWVFPLDSQIIRKLSKFKWTAGKTCLLGFCNSIVNMRMSAAQMALNAAQKMLIVCSTVHDVNFYCVCVLLLILCVELFVFKLNARYDFILSWNRWIQYISLCATYEVVTAAATIAMSSTEIGCVYCAGTLQCDDDDVQERLCSAREIVCVFIYFSSFLFTLQFLLWQFWKFSCTQMWIETHPSFSNEAL